MSEIELNTPPEELSETTESVEPKSILRESMEIHIQAAKDIELSPEEYQRESYKRAIDKIKEIELYVENGTITREEANEILAGQWAKTEIEGLIDPVTYSLNKRGFTERITSAIAHAERTAEELAVAYFDLIGFKNVNDTIGHDAGDKVLLYAADFLRQNIRANDFLSRNGGDEFSVAYPLGNEQAIREKLGEKLLKEDLPQYIRMRMEEDGIDHKETYVTARVGISSLEEGDTVTTLLKRADLEMNAQRDPNDTSDR